MTAGSLLEVLNRHDASITPFSEVQIVESLRAHVKENPPATPEGQEAATAELFAFGVAPSHTDDGNSWGTYYGPTMTARLQDGSLTEWPSIRELQSSTISYWKRRLAQCCHPLLKARYADLIWDLSRRVTGNPPEVAFAWDAIDFTLKAVEADLYKSPIQAKERLIRALGIALAIKDVHRVATVRDAMIGFEQRVGQDARPGLWGFCFDHLIENSKAPLEPEQRAQILGDLEERLVRLAREVERLGPHVVESAALRLARYYQKTGETEELKRVMCAYRDAYVRVAKGMAGLVAQAWLKTVYERLLKYGLRAEAAGIEELLRDYGRQSVNEMKEIRIEVKVSAEEVDDFIEAMTRGSLKECMARIAGHFVLDKEKTASQVLDLVIEAPLYALIPVGLCDSDGCPVATVGSVKEDLEGRVVLQMSQDLQHSWRFLHLVLAALRERGDLSVEGLLGLVGACPLFRDSRMALVKRGLQAYFDEDHIVAVHLLLPQIEAAIRDLVVGAGGEVYRQNPQMGGFSLETLGALLSKPALESVLTVRVCTYLKVLLTDPRGWNLRNMVMHGRLDADQYGAPMSELLLHVLVLLGQVRLKGDSQAVGSGASSSA